MPRPYSKNSVLSRDISVSIKNYCWDNISEFYRRFGTALQMSAATFYRALSGDYSTEETVHKIMMVVDLNKIGFELMEEKNWNVKKIYISELLRLIKQLMENPSMTNLNEMKVFLDRHEGDLQ